MAWRRLAAVGVGVLLFAWLGGQLRSPLGEWASWMSGLLLVWLAGQQLRVGSRLRVLARRKVAVPAAVLALASVAAAFVAFPTAMAAGGTLAGWDFPVHTWHAHVLATELLPTLRGWTHAQAFGWPEGEVYASAAYLPAVLLHLLSFKLVDVEHAVALEVAVVLAGLPLVHVMWHRRDVGAWAAWCGGVFILLDPGSFHQGGAIPLLWAGMWPVRASVVLCVAAVWAAENATQAWSPRRGALLLVLAVAASQTHVAGVTYLGFAGLVWLLARRWNKGDALPALRALGVVALGMAGTAWLLVPFFEERTYLAKIGAGNAGVTQLVSKGLQLGLFDRMSAVELALGLGGAVWLAGRGLMAGRFALAAWVLGSLVLSDSMVLALVPVDMKEMVQRFQLPRYEAFGRNGLLFCAGVVVAHGVAWCGRWLLQPRHISGVPLLGCAVAALLGMVVQTRVPTAFASSELKRARSVPWVTSLPCYHAYLEAGRRLAEHASPDTLLMVEAGLEKEKPSAHIAGLVAMASGLNVVAVDRQGTFEFKDQGIRDGAYSQTEAQASGATHWLANPGHTALGGNRDVVPGMPDGVVLVRLPTVGTGDDQRVLSSSPEVKVLAWERERVVLEGPSTGFAATLRLRWHPRWVVQDQAGVTLRAGPFLPGSRPMFSQLTVPEGVTRVTLVYGPPPGGNTPLWGSVVAVLLGALLAAWPQRARGGQSGYGTTPRVGERGQGHTA